jgi:hypothetical protein
LYQELPTRVESSYCTVRALCARREVRHSLADPSADKCVVGVLERSASQNTYSRASSERTSLNQRSIASQRSICDWMAAMSGNPDDADSVLNELDGRQIRVALSVHISSTGLTTGNSPINTHKQTAPTIDPPGLLNVTIKFVITLAHIKPFFPSLLRLQQFHQQNRGQLPS